MYDSRKIKMFKYIAEEGYPVRYKCQIIYLNDSEEAVELYQLGYDNFKTHIPSDKFEGK
jgi:hypothetical protein